MNAAHQHASTPSKTSTAVAPKAAPAIPAATPVHTFHPDASAPDEPQDPAFFNSGTCHSTPSGVCTLRAAVMEANAEGTYIAVALTAGTYHLTIPPAGGLIDGSSGGLYINDPGTVTFTGAGITQTFVDGAGMSTGPDNGDRIFLLANNAVARMTGFTVQHGNPASTGTLDQGLGGGIDVNTAAALVLQNVRVTANTASEYGGGVYDYGSLWATDSQLTGNSAYDGGGLYMEGSAQLVNVAITGNTANYEGGGVMVNDGSVAFQGGSVSGNHLVFGSGGGQGGGLFIYDNTTMVGTTISNNTVAPGPGASSGDEAQGGGLFVLFGLTQADHLTIRGNTVSGLRPDTGCCAGDGGGGIYDQEGITLTNSVVSQNKALDGIGGGIVNAGSYYAGTDERFSRVTVSGNTATGDGGGLYVYYGATVSQSTVSGNTSGRDGGGIWSDGGVHLDQSLIANNRALQGAGYWNRWHGLLTNDTFTGNVASGSGNAGGAFYESDVDTANTSAQFTNVTISGNRSDDGGGIANFGGAVVLHNSIVANNRGVSTSTDTNCDAAQPLTDAWSNIDSGSTCGLTGPGSRSNTNPKLGALAANGGPTKTMALLLGSPAINAGSSPAPTVDQRNVKRDSKPDIGAFEKK